jgi:MoaA/NifB/PqqE/SkfB family radical SAM enzyme
MISFGSLAKNFRYMIHQRKPKLVARTAMGYSRYLLGSKPRLRYVDVIMDYACNLKCEHCSCQTLRNASRRQLTPDDWGRVAREAEALGAITFGVQGGEPLIYPHIEDVIRNLNPSRNFISVKSNGTVASPELFRNLKAWGVDSITVGFGPVPNEYDFDDYDSISRNLKDAFTTSLQCVKMIADAGIKPMMSAVISRENIRSKVFRGMIDIAKQYDSILNCALAVPVGSWERNWDLMLQKEDRAELNRIMRENPHVRTDFQSNWTIDGCGALKEKVYISPYGDVLPCPFIHISFGNVLEESLETIWRRGIQLKAMKEYPHVCLAAEDKLFLSYLDVAKKKGIPLPIRYDDPDIMKIITTSCAERTEPDAIPTDSMILS